MINTHRIMQKSRSWFTLNRQKANKTKELSNLVFNIYYSSISMVKMHFIPCLWMWQVGAINISAKRMITHSAHINFIKMKCPNPWSKLWLCIYLPIFGFKECCLLHPLITNIHLNSGCSSEALKVLYYCCCAFSFTILLHQSRLCPMMILFQCG